MSGSHRHGTDLIVGAHVHGRGGLGVLGTDVPPESLLANDISLPSEADDEFRSLILTVPSGGTAFFNEDGTVIATGYPDGTHSGTYRGIKNGVTYEPDPATYSFLIGDVEALLPSGIPSAEAFGEPAIAAAIAPAGVASAEAFGSPSIAAGIAAVGIASGEAFGEPTVGDHEIVAEGIPSAEAFGVPTVGTPVVVATPGEGGSGAGRSKGRRRKRLLPTEPKAPAPPAPHPITAVGISSEEAFGVPSIGAGLAPRSATRAEPVFGTPRVRRLPTTAQLIDEMAWLMQR